MESGRGEGTNDGFRYGQRPALVTNSWALWAEWLHQPDPCRPDTSPTQGQSPKPKAVLPQSQYGDALLPTMCHWRAEDQSADTSSTEGGRGESERRAARSRPRRCT